MVEAYEANAPPTAVLVEPDGREGSIPRDVPNEQRRVADRERRCRVQLQDEVRAGTQVDPQFAPAECGRNAGAVRQPGQRQHEELFVRIRAGLFIVGPGQRLDASLHLRSLPSPATGERLRLQLAERVHLHPQSFVRCRELPRGQRGQASGEEPPPVVPGPGRESPVPVAAPKPAAVFQNRRPVLDLAGSQCGRLRTHSDFPGDSDEGRRTSRRYPHVPASDGVVSVGGIVRCHQRGMDAPRALRNRHCPNWFAAGAGLVENRDLRVHAARQRLVEPHAQGQPRRAVAHRRHSAVERQRAGALANAQHAHAARVAVRPAVVPVHGAVEDPHKLAQRVPVAPPVHPSAVVAVDLEPDALPEVEGRAIQRPVDVPMVLLERKSPVAPGGLENV